MHFIYMELPWIGDNRSEAFEKLINIIFKPQRLLTQLAARDCVLFPSLLFHLALRMPSLSMIDLTLSTTLSAGAVAGI